MNVLKKLMGAMLLLGLSGTWICFWIFLSIGISNKDIYCLTLANTNMLLFGILFYIEDHLLK